MSQVMAIVNVSPIMAIPSDIDKPLSLTPAMLLMQDTSAWTTSRYLHKTGCLCPTEMEEVAISSWSILEQVETGVYTQPADKDEVEQKHQNLAVGAIVMMKDEQTKGNNWPMGKVVDAVRSRDEKVRKATVLTSKGRKRCTSDQSVLWCCWFPRRMLPYIRTEVSVICYRHNYCKDPQDPWGRSGLVKLI